MVDLSFTIFGNSSWNYFIVLGILVASGIFAKVITFVIETFLRHRAESSKTKIDDVLIKTLDKPIFWAIILLGIKFSIDFLTFKPEITIFINNAIGVLYILLIAWLLSRFLNNFISTYMHSLASKTESQLDDQLIKISNRIISIAIFAIAFTVILDRFGYDITSIVAGLGIGGLAIALAAQETLKDVFGGVSIFASKPFKVGDMVTVENISGTLEEIGLRYSKIRTWDKRLVTMPNSKLAYSIVENISSEPARRVSFVIGLSYNTSAKAIEKAREILIKIFKEAKGVENDTWRITFEAFGESSLNLRTIYFVNDLDDKFEVMHKVHLKIKEEFDKAGLDFAFPTRTIHMFNEVEEKAGK